MVLDVAGLGVGVAVVPAALTVKAVESGRLNKDASSPSWRDSAGHEQVSLATLLFSAISVRIEASGSVIILPLAKSVPR